MTEKILFCLITILLLLGFIINPNCPGSHASVYPFPDMAAKLNLGKPRGRNVKPDSAVKENSMCQSLNEGHINWSIQCKCDNCKCSVFKGKKSVEVMESLYREFRFVVWGWHPSMTPKLNLLNTLLKEAEMRHFLALITAWNDPETHRIPS